MFSNTYDHSFWRQRNSQMSATPKVVEIFQRDPLSTVANPFTRRSSVRIAKIFNL